jgi:bacteriorhodopsin
MIRISIAVFEITSHVLTLGYAAMAAALFYFLLTIKDNAPRYRMSSVLSTVVMVSAVILLFMQQQSWVNSFGLDLLTREYVLQNGGEFFTNGYRYLNWLIDVPNLLIQILFVAGITGLMFRKYLVQFAASGMLMIVTGYIGQFYEPGRLDNPEGNLFLWILWGVISTAFYVVVLVLITRVIQQGVKNMKGSKAVGIFAAILPLFYISWTIYPVAYVIPLFIETLEWGNTMMVQQVLYTIADITSKIFYGVMLNTASTILSNEQGFKVV